MIQLRKISLIRRDSWADPVSQMDKILTDIQANFDTIARQVPWLGETSAAPTGSLMFLVMDEDGAWQQYELINGAGVTFTLDSALKTLTMTSP